MKKLNILLILGLALLLVSCATVKTSDVKGKTVIVEIPGASKDELFVKASTWMVETFNSSKSVTQYSDKEAGVIKGKYIISFTQGLLDAECESIITIECKDEKCRIIISDPYGFMAIDGRYTNKVTSIMESEYEKIQASITNLCSSFETSMLKNNDTSW